MFHKQKVVAGPLYTVPGPRIFRRTPESLPLIQKAESVKPQDTSAKPNKNQSEKCRWDRGN